MTSTGLRPASPGALPGRWRWTTVALSEPGELLACLPEASTAPAGPLAWVRDGAGLVGWGEVARVRVRGASRFADADAAWSRVTRDAEVDDQVGVPGTGPVAFASFPFADDSADPGVLVVPRVVVGRRDQTWWLTTVTAAGDSSDGAADTGTPTVREVPAGAGGPACGRASGPTSGPGPVTYTDGERTGAQWMEAVSEAVAHIRAGELEKVVLARDVLARTTRPLDVRWLLGRLAQAYPSCWTFAVDGLVGATPELLVRHELGRVHSRVLAGTVGLTGDPAVDAGLAASLIRSAKDRSEHRYAVASVLAALAEHCSSTSAPDVPFLLHLPNVAHLASDVTGVLGARTDGSEPSLFALAGDLHPTAAVCGTPRAAAAALISALEGMDRGRYAGPVGWIDAAGNGELGIALRSAQLGADGQSARLFAGCGIVAASDPAAELEESEAKLVPVREALAQDEGRDKAHGEAHDEVSPASAGRQPESLAASA